jgi:hypothetical protein
MYVVFPLPKRQPFMRMSAQAVSPEIAVDSVARVSIFLSGFKRHREPVMLTCANGEREIWRRPLPADSGFFADTVLAALPSSRVGTFLYLVRARQQKDSLFSACHVVQQVIPQRTAAVIYAARPSLDQRFLTLALTRRPEWRLTDASHGSTADVAFFLQHDSDTRARLAALPREATAVFVGCVACDSSASFEPRSLTPILNPAFAGDTGKSAIASLPPPTRVWRCGSRDTQRGPVMLWASAVTPEGKTIDSLPLFYEYSRERRRMLVLAVEGLWRWDFWPLSLAHDRAQVTFTDFLLGRVRELARANMNRTMYAFPEKSPVYDADSTVFRLVLPAHFQEKLLDEVRLTVTGAAGRAADTLMKQVYAAGNTVRIAVAPLGRGAYRYECLVRSDEGAMRYTDSLDVYANNAELAVDGQNTILLGQIATPVTLSDTAAAPLFLQTQNPGNAVTQSMQLRIRQSAPLLALLLLLMAVEWFLRKHWRID